MEINEKMTNVMEMEITIKVELRNNIRMEIKIKVEWCNRMWIKLEMSTWFARGRRAVCMFVCVYVCKQNACPWASECTPSTIHGRSPKVVEHRKALNGRPL